jgi:micrococcal nuclease
MTKTYLTPIATVLLLGLLSMGATEGTSFRVSRVYDGDTIKAERAGEVIYIMLVGIDAPEISTKTNPSGQPFAEAAKAYLSDRINDRLVEIKGHGTGPDRYKNILGEVYLDGKNINLEMVSNGFAEACKHDLPSGFEVTPYVKAEENARSQKRGMWVQGDRYESPQVWRQKYIKAGGLKR